MKRIWLIYLFDLLSVLCRTPSQGNPQTLLIHHHSGLPFTPLDLRQPSFLLLLSALQLLNHSLVIVLHLFLLLKTIHATRGQEMITQPLTKHLIDNKMKLRG